MTQLPLELQSVLQTLEEHGYEAWCVGGCVRDLLLGRQPDDWDVTTSALPEQTMALFGERAAPTGLAHGTVTVRGDGLAVEVTTFRCDGPYADGRHPERVTFTRSLKEDLRRRDFTVNAMALDLRGALADPFGGRSDLAAGVLRCVGEPKARLREDGLRIMRCLRFSAVLAFSVEAATAESLHGERALLEKIAAERLRSELTKLLCGQKAVEVLREYPDVVGVFLPELLPMVGFSQRNPHHCYDLWEHTLHAVAAVPPDPLLRYTMLFHDLGKVSTFRLDEKGVGHFYGHGKVSRALADQVMERLRFDGASRRRILLLVEYHDYPLCCAEKPLRRALRRFGEEGLRQLLTVKRADNLAQHPDFWGRQRELDETEWLLKEILSGDACFSLAQLAVHGRDLLALGYEGPALGRVLDELLDLVVEDKLPNEQEALLQYARSAKKQTAAGTPEREEPGQSGKDSKRKKIAESR